jgi:RNA recognition motif-containing protein
MKFVTDLGINGCKSARTVIQKETGRSRGFGYLDFIYKVDITEAEIVECFNTLKHEFSGSKFYFNRIKNNTLKW